ncbi:MAG: hypothetical protein K0Q89_850 [Thermomicrobiales bacterium]|jgi:hypothetical protein|nr:hypothetical protein [Thermomicrobiales bacterium]
MSTGTGVYGIVFETEEAANAFLDKCNQWLLETTGIPDIWDRVKKHPTQDLWAVGYADRIQHLLDGLVPVELECDYLDACIVIEPAPPEPPEPEPQPIILE